jgi:hypothetical protein
MHPMFIELLEARIAPAGIIDVVRTGNALHFKAQPATDGNSSLTLTGSSETGLRAEVDGTTALRFEGQVLSNGQSLDFSDFFGGNIQVNLGTGNDNLILIGQFPAKVTADLGVGENELVAANALISGDLIFKGNSGDDQLSLVTANIGGNLVANLAGGKNTLAAIGAFAVGKNFTLTSTGLDDSLIAAGTNATILGNVTMKVVSGTAGFDVTGNLFIGKNLALTTKTGPVAIAQRVEALGDIVIGGSVKLSASGSTPVLIQTLGSSDGRVSVGGNVSMTSKGVGQLGSQDIRANSFVHVGGSVTLLGAPKVAAALSQVQSLPSLIGGSLKVAGQSTILVELVGQVAGSGTFLASGEDAADFKIDPFGVSTRLTFGKAVSITMGNSTAAPEILLENVTFSKTLKMKDGSGSTTLTMNDTSVAGSLTADFGAGVDTINLDTKTAAVPAVFYGPVLIKAGADHDMFRLTLTVDSSLVAWNTFVIDGGPGPDSVLSIGTTTFAVPVVKKNIESDL